MFYLFCSCCTSLKSQILFDVWVKIYIKYLLALVMMAHFTNIILSPLKISDFMTCSIY